ncbi:MAG: TolC family protein [Bacteroidales bacterium]
MKKIILYICLFACGLKGFSQDSLAFYLETAIRNNPTVLQRYSEYQAALQKVPQVGSLPDPQLEMGIYLSPMEQLTGNRVADFKLMQMFSWFGVIKNAKDEMSLMAKAKFETFRDAKLQVGYDVHRVWLDLYRVRRSIKLSEQNLDLLKTIERLAVAKYRSGSSSGSSSKSVSAGMSSGNAPTAAPSGMNAMGGASKNAPSRSSSSPSMGGASNASGLADVYQLQIEQGDVENNLVSLKNEEQALAVRFNNLLNVPRKTAIHTPDSLSVQPLDIAYLTVNDSMFTQNPMLGMLAYEQQSLDSRSKMQRTMGFPVVGLGVNYSILSKSTNSMTATSSMNGQDMIMPMVTVTLPIYRKKFKAMQAETNYQKTATKQNYEATVNALQTDYAEALQSYSDAQRRMKLYETQSQLSKKMLDIQIKTFSASGSGLSDILRIRQQLLDYELRKLDAVIDLSKMQALVRRLVAI